MGLSHLSFLQICGHLLRYFTKISPRRYYGNTYVLQGQGFFKRPNISVNAIDWKFPPDYIHLWGTSKNFSFLIVYQN